MSLDIPKIIEAIKGFNKPLVFLVFGLLAYWAIPLGILGLQLDWIPKVKVIGLISIFVGIALGSQAIWDYIKSKKKKYDTKKNLKKILERLTDKEKDIVYGMFQKGHQSCAAHIYVTEYSSLVSKSIACFGANPPSDTKRDFHITDEAWEVLEEIFKKDSATGGNHAS